MFRRFLDATLTGLRLKDSRYNELYVAKRPIATADGVGTPVGVDGRTNCTAISCPNGRICGTGHGRVSGRLARTSGGWGEGHRWPSSWCCRSPCGQRFGSWSAPWSEGFSCAALLVPSLPRPASRGAGRGDTTPSPGRQGSRGSVSRWCVESFLRHCTGQASPGHLPGGERPRSTPS
jgi:hypothetical protein